VYWVQAEALVTALHLYRLTGNPAYFQSFTKTLEWVVARQVDWKRGEWFSKVDQRGTPSGAKGDMWKSGYHSARATILPLRMLPALERGHATPAPAGTFSPA
jgi:cellobiose epimerase